MNPTLSTKYNGLNVLSKNFSSALLVFRAMPKAILKYKPKANLALKNAFGAVLLSALLSLLLGACSNLNSNSSTLFQSQSRQSVNHGLYTVQKGDSLYSIAWRFKRDYKELAKINNINTPYTIYAGQEISLAHLADEIPSKSGYTGQSVISPRKSKVVVKPITKRTTRSTPTITKTVPVRTSTSTSSNQWKKGQTSAVKTKVKPQPAYANNSIINWKWPSTGKVIQGFSRSSVGKKGIQISGNTGDPIKAVANGQVVYSGNSLLGYGNLVIVKHSDTYLSAYAHNRRVIVKEGASVKQGQKIAEMGSSGTDRNKLHFEIRKDGKPVNPLSYLPRR